ncbi:ribosomal protein S18 acetylase RimI-like enzyme [Kineosporia succinea]|uniref:Ribosomal protein S18 acetylase RimI-like enzyme n=1 Tax=Kineosporia succinea TaxID=84632 RepID=A0ABT9PDG0_9ACTN|nr:GNAT family N-acetyltransferase [Kineosporia succinea]MDP9830739.1 ribosomal protein S18 acetylase RimI-like enzyme [Kineosporia succinea]
MTGLSLRPMTPDEFVTWQEQLARDFAEDKVTAGAWPADGALDRARRFNAETLPQGLDTPRMLMLRAVLDDGTPVGQVWITFDHPRGAADCAFLYDIEVDAAHRGRGLGRALLEAAERTVREHGLPALELNVFGGNDRAIALYRSAGYAVTSQLMRKSLD